MSNQKNNQTLDVNETIVKSEAFVIKYKNQILAAVAAVVLAVGGIFAYIYGYSQPREDKAQELLGIAMQTYLPQEDFEHALKGEGTTLGFEQIAKEYSSTDAGNLAKYEAGYCNFKLGKFEEAIKYLEDFDTQSDNVVSAQALNILANSYANNKQLDEAVKTFKKAANATKVPALCAQYLFNAGVILDNQNKSEEALKLFQDIKASYPTAPVCMENAFGEGILGNAVIDKYIEKLSK